MEILAEELDLKPPQIKRENTLIEELGMDSLSGPFIATGLEAHYEKAISEEDFNSMSTVGQLYDYFHPRK